MPARTSSNADATPRIRVGTYGFAYKEWVGPFYPAGTVEGDRLPYYASVFNAVELVHTYYGAPKPPAVGRWRDQAPDDFKITIKAPRWLVLGIDRAAKKNVPVTSGPVDGLKTLFETLAPLGRRLGPVVLRMEDNFECPAGLAALDQFLEATAPSRSHVQSHSGLAFEFHHPSWWQHAEAELLLRRHNVAWVWNDVEPREPGTDPIPRAIDDPSALRDTSGDFVYVRLSGSHAGKKTHYTAPVDRSAELQRWSDLVKQCLANHPNRTAYVMLSDHYAGAGPDTARKLQRLLS